MEIKLKDSFKNYGLGSYISWDRVKEMLEKEERRYNSNINTDITGFIINDEGIQIQKEYI